MAEKKSLRERLQKQRENMEKGSGSFPTFIFPKPGTYRHRHVNVGKENEFAIEATCFFLGKDLGMVVSPKTFGKKCALYEAYEELKNSKKSEDQEFAKRLKPKRRFLSPSYRYMDEKGKEVDPDGVKITMLFPDQYQQMIDMYLDDGDGGDFTDPKTGYDIKHKRIGTGQFDTEYSSVRCNPTPCPKEFRGPYNVEEMVMALVPTYSTTEELRDKFLNLSLDAEDDSPKPKKKSDINSDSDKPKKKKKKSK